MPLAVKIGIIILILFVLWVLVFFVQRWIGPSSEADAATTTPNAHAPRQRC